jgi:hypothetical protein
MSEHKTYWGIDYVRYKKDNGEWSEWIELYDRY